MFSVSVDLSGFRSLATETLKVLAVGTLDAVQAAAEAGAIEARTVGRFKDRTGNLRAGIVARYVHSPGLSARWDIVSKAKYSKFVEQGTRPHVIVAVRAVALRFVVGGKTVFAKRVNHPGTAAMPYMGPAYLKAEGVLYRDFSILTLRVQRMWQ